MNNVCFELRTPQPQHPPRLLLVAAGNESLPHGGHQQMVHTLSTICGLAGPLWPARTHESFVCGQAGPVPGSTGPQQASCTPQKVVYRPATCTGASPCC